MLCTISEGTGLSCYSNCILFTKLPWSGHSKETFRSSSQAATCLPPAVEASPDDAAPVHTVPLIAERQAGKL